MITMKKRTMLTVLGLLFCLQLTSQNIQWSIRPQYDDINLYSSQVYKYRNEDKVGLLNKQGIHLLPYEVDSITNIVGGYALALNKVNAKWKIEGIYEAEGASYNVVKGNFYTTRYPFFSEGLLCVSGNNDKQGYINSAGLEVISCQFLEARPFCEGLASVELKQHQVIYINERFDTNGKRPLIISFHNGDLTFGSSFKNGKALVGNYSDFAFIDQRGNKIKNYKVSEGKIPINKTDYTFIDFKEPNAKQLSSLYIEENKTVTAYQENGLWGYKSNGITLLPNQLEMAFPFINGYAKAKSKGKYGLLSLSQGNYAATFNREHIAIYREKQDSDCVCTLSIPSNVDKEQLHVQIDRGDGSYEDALPAANTESQSLYAFTPYIDKGATQCTVKITVFVGDLKAWEESKMMQVDYPVNLIIQDGTPRVTQERADSLNHTTVFATVFNDSAIPVNAKLTLHVTSKLNAPCSSSKEQEIPPGGTLRIETVMTVTENETVKALVTVNGEGQERKVVSKNITVETFY